MKSIKPISDDHECECDCGELIAFDKRFKKGHHCRKHPKPIPNHHECACGCSELVASDKRFKYGHGNKGRKFGPASDEHKRKNKESQERPDIIERKIRSAKLTNAKPEVKERRSRSGKIGQNKPGVQERKIQTLAITNALPETKEKRRQSALVAGVKPETKERRSRSAKIAQNRPETKARSVQTATESWQDPEYREQQNNSTRSISCKKIWQDPEYRDSSLQSMNIARNLKPNNPEHLIDLITQEYFTRWQYSGDYSVIINGKNPDFINYETRQIIEFYGDYWHQGEDPTDRAEIFAEAGFDLCVIWEHELQDLDEVIAKLRRFCGRCYYE